MRSHGRSRIVLPILCLVALVGCSSKQHLGEYDFRSRTLAVTTIAPPYPEVFTGLYVSVDPARPVESILRAGGGLAREATATRIRARLDTAATKVSVPDRISMRVLQGASRHLRAVPTTDARRADYELEIRIRRYGIEASSWSSQAYFTIDADLMLLDGATGRRIWKSDVSATDVVRPGVFGGDVEPVSGAITAIALSRMSAAEMQRALEGLSDFASDYLVRKLADSLDDARG